jgi:glycosyltransferase involved in cell wall biosynthesis
MKILVALGYLEIGGSVITAVELAGSVHRQFGWEPVIYAPDGPASKIVAERGLRHVEAPDGMRLMSPKTWRHLLHTVERERVDIVHAWDWQQMIRCFYGLHLRGFPVIASYTDMKVHHEPWRRLPKGLPVTFVSSDIVEQDQPRRGSSFLQPYPINTDLDDPADVDGSRFRESLGVDADEVLMVLVSRVARIQKRESIGRTIEVVGEIGADWPVTLAVVGDGEARPELEAAGAAVNARLGREAVRFTGALVDPRPAYAAADISLGMGTSICRAMAFGAPAIVLGELGFSGLYTPESADFFDANGFYALGDGAAHNDGLRDQILQLLRDPALAERLGDYALEAVRTRYSVDVVAADLAERYELVAASPVDRGREVKVRAAVDFLPIMGRNLVTIATPDKLKAMYRNIRPRPG